VQPANAKTLGLATCLVRAHRSMGVSALPPVTFTRMSLWNNLAPRPV
jgi:hypothetical protein